MTNQFQLRSFVFLLTLRGLVSSIVEDSSNATELHPTSGPPLTTGIREGRFPETTHSQPDQGNGTSKNPNNVEGTETNGTKHPPTGNESLASTETPLQTSFPEKHASSDSTTASSAPAFSASANGTNTVPIAVTTTRIPTEGPSTSGTTVKSVLTSTEEKSTNHTPTTVHSTHKTDLSTTKVCPTAEPKKDNLVGRCLIVIASLSAVSIVFIITTIILATKLTGSRYRHRARLLHETEMVCISALMNDCDHPLPTQKHPKSNGALIPITEDEDGDDLTLNSFLHDTEGTA
ncbi:P-selectin glycoprotein ligand 1 isoform 1-T2 [Clarias gariepinus]|uniref:P-selectin glycoprotein ligand 1 n=1 Tax=Clarias gariepinus TaxID=13013 RepID=UPI00234C4B7B|nr:P-selectin glycoprotein ligand 1 [Clarias gariepinus]XP_053336531.1 P-selectin glycoprotein ligand 1 [Clarias gariepinus]